MTGNSLRTRSGPESGEGLLSQQRGARGCTEPAHLSARLLGTQTPGPRASGAQRSARPPRPLARPPPAEGTAPWPPNPTLGSGRARSACAPRAPSPAPHPASVPRSSQRPGSRGPRWHPLTCFRGISTFSMAVSESKSASLRSLPGIAQRKQLRPIGQVHRVERKRPYHPFGAPTFVTSGSKAVPAEAESPREAGAHVVPEEEWLFRLVRDGGEFRSHRSGT